MRKRRPDAKPRPRLDLDRVIEAAIALLNEEGLDSLTTRRLAEKLGVRSAALYWYVRDKDELLDLVADAICTPALEPTIAVTRDPSLSWREQATAALGLYRAVLRSHRDAPRLLADRPPVGPVRRSLADAAAGGILAAGFADADAAVISLLLGDYVISIVSEEIRIEAWASAAAQTPPQEIDLEDATKFPNLYRVAQHMPAIGSGRLFEVGLEILLDGIEQRLKRSAP